MKLTKTQYKKLDKIGIKKTMDNLICLFSSFRFKNFFNINSLFKIIYGLI